MFPRSRALWATLSFLLVSSAGADAVTLDWDTVTWTPGVLTNSFDIDSAKTGDDVTVTVSGNTAQLQPEIAAPRPMTPTVATAFQGGLAQAEKSLCIAIDLSKDTQFVTVTLDFSAEYAAGIYHLSFTLFDIDFGNNGSSTYQDQLSSIYGTDAGGAHVAPTITTSLNNTVVGTGLTRMVNGTVSTSDSGDTSANGNVTIDFGHTAIRSFTFTYGSSTLFKDPTYQHVGLYDFTYSPVPEINPAWSAVFSCCAATILILRHRANFRK